MINRRQLATCLALVALLSSSGFGCALVLRARQTYETSDKTSDRVPGEGDRGVSDTNNPYRSDSAAAEDALKKTARVFAPVFEAPPKKQTSATDPICPDDCVGNGICSNNECTCFAGWRGPNCASRDYSRARTESFPVKEDQLGSLDFNNKPMPGESMGLLNAINLNEK